ncbi:hypothetical protein FACS1894214_4350 [Planctomycetales bacterium]|nr:hypothetical protein FACS1894214_4350 [Planctomycetales bacterium]
MLTFLSNLYTLLTKAPQIVGIITAIINLIGSENVRSILESIKNIIQEQNAEVLSVSGTASGNAECLCGLKDCIAHGLLLEAQSVEFSADGETVQN